MFFKGAFTSAKNWILGVSIWLIHSDIALAVSENFNLDTEEPVATPMPSMFSLLVKLVVSLIIVGGLAYLTIKFLKKNTQITGGSSNISVLDQLALGMNKGLYIVEVTGQVLVLGVTDHSINILYQIDDKETIKELRRRAEEQETPAIIPPKFLELFGAKIKNASESDNFSSHIQEQINKLRTTASGSKTNSGEDEPNGQNES